MEYNKKILNEKVIRFLCIHNDSISNIGDQELLYNGILRSYVNNSNLITILDITYIYAILGLLDLEYLKDSRLELIKKILSFQNDKGWFEDYDEQHHSKVHITAYALSALKLLSNEKFYELLQSIKPFIGLNNILSQNNRDYLFNLNFLERVHFWRGSHVVGGVPSIVGILSENGAKKKIDLKKPREWLNNWAELYNSKMDVNTGYWRLSPQLIQNVFDFMYKYKHNPEKAMMGGAAHLYWIFEKINFKFDNAKNVIMKTISLQKESGLYDDYPYCIDFDANFIISRSLKYLKEDDYSIKELAINALNKNRNAIISWLCSKHPNDWYKRIHLLPGALAAIAEVEIHGDRIKNKYINLFNRVWWL